MRHQTIPLAAVLFVSSLASADTGQADQPLRLVPTPRQIAKQEGAFAVTAETQIVLKSTDPVDKFAAGQLVAEAKTDLDVELKVVDSPAGNAPAIVLQRQSINLPAEAIAEGYLLNVAPDGITLQASTSAGLFYGVQTIKQLIRANATGHSLPACSIADWPMLRYRGWQDDISRGPIPTLDFLKQEIRTMAEMKENVFTLYTEHVFKLKKHPDIAPADGITTDEVKELAEYAKQYHVELVGNFQSFGHFANILKLPKYAPLGANSWALDPANEDAYKFLADVYSEVATAYPSQLFCISCDEVGNLDKPDAQALIKRLGEGGAYAYHINRVNELLKPYGKTPMMWGDIAMQHPADIKKLPRDLIVLPWTYDDRGTFDPFLQPYVNASFRTIVCPGANNWNRLWPDVDQAAHNISDFTRDGFHYNTLGQLNTTWRDSGESLEGANFYPLLWGAECAWSPVTDPADRTDHKAREAKRKAFDRAFDGVFYGLSGADVALANRALGSGVLSNPVAGGNNDGNFWKDPAVAHAEAKTTEPAAQLVAAMDKVIAAANSARASAKHNAYTLDELAMAAKRVRFLGQRVLAVDALPKSPGAWKDLLANLDAIKAQYTQLWHMENRDWWLDRNLAKFDALEKSIKALPTRVSMSPARPQFASEVTVTITALAPGEIHYTTDGTEPTEKSPVYAAPLALHKTTTIKARNFVNGQAGPVSATTYAALKMPAIVRTRLPVYQDNAPERAFDGSDDSFFWAATNAKKDDWFTVVLDTPKNLKHIAVRTGHPQFHRDYLEHGVVDVSPDGKAWSTLTEFHDGKASAPGPDTPVKSIRIRVTESQAGWLAIREIDAE